MLSPTADSVRIRYPLAELLLWVGIAIGLPCLCIAIDPFDFLATPPFFVLMYAVVDFPFIMLAFTACKFEVRADDQQILHREIVTRRIPTASVEQIRVATEEKQASHWGWSVEHTKIEIVGDNKWILVSWRTSKLAPLLQFLEQRFPERIEWVDSLPSI